MKVRLSLSHNKTYLLACSYGPDSMFLYNLLIKKHVNFVVCHVNYHKRPESNSEEASLREVCKKDNVLLEVLDTSKMKAEGNFQAWAREVRYKFFKECYQKYNASALLVAHNQDDVIETYCIQKRRQSLVNHFGISAWSVMDGMNVYRPLLNIKKSDLQESNDKNGVPYAIDSSNLEDDYERNRIRHSYVSGLSDEERQKVLKEIDEVNRKIDSIKKEVALLISESNSVEIDKVKSISIDKFSYLLFVLLDRADAHIALSSKQIKEFMDSFDSDKSNIVVPLGDDTFYYQEYGEISIHKKHKPYSYVLNQPTNLNKDEFYIDFSLGAEDRNIKESDYPLTIRSPKEKDTYKIKDYVTPINRLFIDWKMPMHLRDIWPVIENKDGEIIYIPRYRKDFKDDHKSTFKIKIK